MKFEYKKMAGALLVAYLFIQWNGFSCDRNEVVPDPTIYSARGGSGGFYYSSK